MANDELDAMLVRNLEQARIANDRMEHAIQPKAQIELQLALKQRGEAFGWHGGFDWNEDDLWLCPPEWIVSNDVDGGDRSYLAVVTFETDGRDGEGPGSDHYWLVTLCGAGRGRYGLKLKWDKGLGTTKSRWRKFVNGHPAIGRLVALGYALDEDGNLFRQVELDAEALATAIETNDWERFVAPLVSALDGLPAATAIFGEIVAAARIAPIGN